ncbi:MAG: PAS domain S-box protein, partial [bacterium]
RIIMAAIQEAVQTGRHRGATYSLDMGGEVKWYELSIATKGEPTSDGSRFILTIRDVSERVRADAALRESEKRYRELQNNVPIGLFQSTVDGRVVFVNEAVVKMFGYESAKEILESTAFAAYDDPASRERLLQKLQRCGSIKGFETSLKRRDGSTFWGSMDISTGCEETGEITRFDGTLTDITDRKIAEAALASSEQRYRLLVENINMAIARVSYDGEFLFVNQYGAATLDKEQADLIGTTMWDLFPKSAADRQVASIREAIDTGQTLTRETRTEIGKRWHWYNTTIQPYPDTDSHIKSAMIMADDVTERRRAEEELRVAHEGLKAEQQALVVKNIALKELLGQIDDEKQRIKQQIQANLDRVALPMLETLAKRLPDDLQTTTRVLEQCLKDIGSPYIGELESRFSTLTPREVEVCNMIHNGFHSKEIARELEISVRTVEKTRQHIRKKLGIANREINLTSFLRNI